MNGNEVDILLADARKLPKSPHRESLIRQLAEWSTGIPEPLPTRNHSRGTEHPADGFGTYRSRETAGELPLGLRRLTPDAAPLPTQPIQPSIPSELDCIDQVSRGDASPADLLVDTYGWERLAITRKLIILLPRDGTRDFFVIPVEAEFVMGAFDEIVSTILFDHTPGQLRYTCEKACEVERTGFAVERLKDSDYWRTRRLTRGILVH